MKDLTISRAMAIATLKLDREVARAEIADILGVTRQTAIKQKDRLLTPEQKEKIEKALGITLSMDTKETAANPLTSADKIEIQYWGKGLPCEEKLKNSFITSLWFDREVINGGWQKDEKYLNIIAMPGDKMDGGNYPLKNNDILVIDTSETDISISGIYFYTTNNNEEVFVNNFRKIYDGTIILGVTNPKYKDTPTDQEKLDAAGVKIIGRVIKNLFFTI